MRVRGCVHSTYARFRPFLTHPSPLYAFHTLRLDPSLLYIRNWLTHPPFIDPKVGFLALSSGTNNLKASVALLFFNHLSLRLHFNNYLDNIEKQLLRKPFCLVLFNAVIHFCIYNSNMVFKAIISVGAWTLGGAKFKKLRNLWALHYGHTQRIDPSTHPVC